jgi:hypothetical protein
MICIDPGVNQGSLFWCGMVYEKISRNLVRYGKLPVPITEECGCFRQVFSAPFKES